MEEQERTYFWMGPTQRQVGEIITPEKIGFYGRFANKQLVVSNEKKWIQEEPTIIERKPHGPTVVHNRTNLYAPNQDDVAIALLETVFEMVRCCEFPQLPSRFSCLFLWERRDWAEEYLGNADYAELYEVSVRDQQKLFRGDFALITYFELPDTINKMRARARRYWTNGGAGKYETLVQGNLEILRRVV